MVIDRSRTLLIRRGSAPLKENGPFPAACWKWEKRWNREWYASWPERELAWTCAWLSSSEVFEDFSGSSQCGWHARRSHADMFQQFLDILCEILEERCRGKRRTRFCVGNRGPYEIRFDRGGEAHLTAFARARQRAPKIMCSARLRAGIVNSSRYPPDAGATSHRFQSPPKARGTFLDSCGVRAYNHPFVTAEIL